MNKSLELTHVDSSRIHLVSVF